MVRPLAITLVAGVLLAGCGTPTIQDKEYIAVTRIVDGDTVVIGGETIRPIGLDTPETVSPSVKDECGGQEATAEAHKLLDGRRVLVVSDPSQGERDRYGRRLAYLDIEGVGDFSELMIWHGFAKEYTYDKPYARQQVYKELENEARNKRLETWGRCGGFDTPLVPK